MGAKARSGHDVPSSSELRDLLLEIAFPGERPDPETSLGEAYSVALKRNRTGIRRLLETRLSLAPDRLPDFFHLYFNLPWYRVYTLNVDDIEMAAAQRFALRRAPITISATAEAFGPPPRPGGA